MNKSVMKCCICNNENIGQFITINNKKYHLYGLKVRYIDNCKGVMREFYYDCEKPEDAGHWQEEIKSVITHEQMEQMAYKVVE